MKTLEIIFTMMFIIVALMLLISGEFTLFEGFVAILLGNILLAIREGDLK